MTNNIILNIDSVRKSFVRNIISGHGEDVEERFYVLSNVDLLIPKCTITALIGGNGTGKTTLFNIISGFYHPDEGKIEYRSNGLSYEITGMDTYRIARLGIGRMFQDNHIFQEMTILENMLVADTNTFGEQPFEAIIKAKKNAIFEKQRVDKAEQIFVDLFSADNPFTKMKNEKAKFLSYGQQRLLGLMRLLMGNYLLLLLDEPTSGVNSLIIEKIKDILRYFVRQKKMTVFIIEHNMKFVLDVAEFCHFMSQGAIAASGTPEDILGNPEVRRTYLGI